MRYILVILLVFLLSCTAAPPKTWKEPRDFWGIDWGTPFATVQQRRPWMQCTREGGRMPICTDEGWMTDDIKAEVRFFFDGPQEGLGGVMVTFPTIQFFRMQQAMRNTYGPPTRHTFPVTKDRLGSELLNETLEWVGTRIEIKLEQYGGPRVSGHIEYFVPTQVQR